MISTEDVPVSRGAGHPCSDETQQIKQALAGLRPGQSFVVPPRVASRARWQVREFNGRHGGAIHTRTDADGNLRVGRAVDEMRIIGEAPWLFDPADHQGRGPL